MTTDAFMEAAAPVALCLLLVLNLAFTARSIRESRQRERERWRPDRDG